MKRIYFAFCACLLLFVISCSSSKQASSGSASTTNKSKDNTQELNPAIDLADQLKRVPGVDVTGSGSSAKVSIRGMSSFSDAEPLFVINGAPVNGGLSAASSMVSVPDIKSIHVLKSASETSPYGLSGSAGVIVITLK